MRNNFRAKRKYKHLKINILQLFHKDSNLLIYNIAPAVQFQRFKGFTHQRCLFHCSKAAVSKVQGFRHQRCLFHRSKAAVSKVQGFMHQRCLFHCSKAAVSKVQGFRHQMHLDKQKGLPKQSILFIIIRYDYQPGF